ncbi:hypothetical protein CH063_04056 [Colletotrichum higginsianum]|uniref:Uncharacterized protein n=1 Tax=Colletotrichum higginsianum (strain IMI 349063) TaxID=759273 RepID=H1W3R2_COLHI|nr:hypothetical protein CH063_04056 [Colletotrichum higginsianum]
MKPGRVRKPNYFVLPGAALLHLVRNDRRRRDSLTECISPSACLCDKNIPNRMPRTHWQSSTSHISSCLVIRSVFFRSPENSSCLTYHRHQAGKSDTSANRGESRVFGKGTFPLTVRC